MYAIYLRVKIGFPLLTLKWSEGIHSLKVQNDVMYLLAFNTTEVMIKYFGATLFTFCYLFVMVMCNRGHLGLNPSPALMVIGKYATNSL